MKFTSKKIIFFLSLAFTLLSATSAKALVEKFILMDDKNLKLNAYYKANLDVPENWTEDKYYSQELKINILVPKEKNFNSAEAIIYSSSTHKNAEMSLEKFIKDDQDVFKKDDPGIKITFLGNKKSKSGITFQLYTYERKKSGNQPYEIMATTIDNDKDGNSFFVNIVLSGKTKASVDSAKPLYDKVIEKYK